MQFRDISLAGETLTIWARVADKKRAGQFGLVKLVVGMRNEHAKESIQGSAVVAPPYADGSAVPYPFQPGDAVGAFEEPA